MIEDDRPLQSGFGGDMQSSNDNAESGAEQNSSVNAQQFIEVSVDGLELIVYEQLSSGSPIEVARAPTSEVIEKLKVVIQPQLLNYFFGAAGTSHATGSRNVGLGPGAGQSVSSGSRNVLAGYNAGRDIFVGSDNVIIGDSAAYAAQGAANNVIIGSSAMSLSTGSRTSNIAIGRNAAYTYNGNEVVAVGAYALNRSIGGPCTAIGTNAGGTTTTGSRQTLIGFNALGGAENNDVIAIGHGASATESGQIALGTKSQTHIKALGIDFARWDANAYNFWIGTRGPLVAPTGERNIGIGPRACNSITSGGSNIGIGESALELQQSQSSCIAIGVAAAQLGVDLSDCTYVGTRAGRFNATGVGATAVGFRALEQGNSANNNTGLGDSAGWVCQGSGNVFAGYVSGENKRDGDECVAIGRATARNRLDGSHCVLIGGSAGAISSGFLGVNQADGTGGTPAGSRVIGIGYRAVEEFLGSDVIAIGHEAGRSLLATPEQVLGSIFIGNFSGNNEFQKTDVINSVAIGHNTYNSRNDQVVLGNEHVQETILRGIVKSTVFLVADLPEADALAIGSRAFVSDAQSVDFNAALLGGGSGVVPVFCDGTTWRVG